LRSRSGCGTNGGKSASLRSGHLGVMSSATVGRALRLLNQATDLLAEATAMMDQTGASMALLEPTHAKLLAAMDAIGAKDFKVARSQIGEAKNTLSELRSKMPAQPSIRPQ
jgi:hypothetical protein